MRDVAPALSELVDFIDWQFFFHAWDLKGKFPAILDNPAARELYDDATALLAEITSDELLQARGVHGYWPAHADGDDVVVADTRFCFLRQQGEHTDGRPNRSLADYVAPAGDHLGAFAVSIHGADELAARFEAEHDDYRAIIVKALADRLAEACAEWLHLSVRREWYAPDEQLPLGDVFRERFRGIRPAFGYPACPDHSEKTKLFDLLGAENAGMELTESFAMTPAAAVSGIYLAHPQAKYFAVGRIGDDQLGRLRAPQGGDRGGGRAVAHAKPVLIVGVLALAVAGAAQANQIRLNKADQARGSRGGRPPGRPGRAAAGAAARRSRILTPGSGCIGYHPKDTDLVTTGAAETEWTNGALTFTSEVLLLETATMVGPIGTARSGRRRSSASSSCSPASSGRKHGSSRPREPAFSPVARYTANFRIVFDVSAGGRRVRILVDVLLVGKGRAEMTLTTIAPYAARAAVQAAELRLARLVAKRLPRV